MEVISTEMIAKARRKKKWDNQNHKLSREEEKQTKQNKDRSQLKKI